MSLFNFTKFFYDFPLGLLQLRFACFKTVHSISILSFAFLSSMAKYDVDKTPFTRIVINGFLCNFVV